MTPFKFLAEQDPELKRALEKCRLRDKVTKIMLKYKNESSTL